MHSVGQDLWRGARLLWKAPAFAAVALAALALGIGATTAIFSVVDAVLLKPLPFRDAERLLVIWEKNPALNRFKMYVAPGNYAEWRRQSRSLEGLAAFQQGAHVNLTGGPNGRIEPEELRAERVSAELFPLLGVQPAVGRVFQNDEDRPGHTNFALLSYGLWQRRFGGDRGIAGKAVRLRDQSYTVVGVLPPDFALLDSQVDVWLPLGLNPSDARSAALRNLTVIGRLTSGVGLDQARSEMDDLGARLEQANAWNAGWRPSLFPFREELAGKTRQAVLVLLGAVGLLLLMACANVANLLLARGAGRQKEVAIRTALGAGRGQVIAQLLAEAVVLALAGGVLGLLVARGAIALVARFGGQAIPPLASVRMDGRLFGFALVASILTGLVFGIAPALQSSRVNLNAALTEGGRGGTAGRAGRRLRNTLVVSEVMLAVMVLIGAGLLIRSFLRLRQVNAGFQPSGVLTFRLPLSGARNATADRRTAFFQDVNQRIAALPGVQTAGAASALPLTGLGVGTTFAVEGRPAPPADRRPMGLVRSVTPSYFRAMGIPQVAGRGFSEADKKDAPSVILVNRSMARRFWPDGNAIGGRLALDNLPQKSAQVVGIVGDVKADRIQGEDWPTIYFPYPQAPAATMVVTVRTSGPPLAMANAVVREVHQMDPEQPVADMRPMDAVMDEAVADTRLHTMIFGVFGVIAMALAIVGIYGVISYDVTQRTHEIGIRVALGAQRDHVLRLIVGQGARLAAIGIWCGLVAAFGLTRLMGSMLYGVNPTDFFTFAGMAALLGAVALAASYLPSRRAMALDPVVALRHE